MSLINIPISQHDTIPVYAKDQHHLNMIIGQNLHTLQKKTNLTQKEFLEMIGFNQKYPAQYFSRISRGEVGVKLHTLLVIQKTFTVSLEQLITPKGV